MDSFPKKTYNGQQLHAKMLNITNHQGNAHNNHDLNQLQITLWSQSPHVFLSQMILICPGLIQTSAFYYS